MWILDVTTLPLETFVRRCSTRLRDGPNSRIATHAPKGDKPRRGCFHALYATAIALLLAACAGEGPEAELRATLAAMEAAVEAKQPGDFVEHVTDDFTSGDGLDRRSLRGVLASQLLGAQTVEVVLGSPEITLHGERATVVVDATVLGGRYLPDRAERLRITSGWRREGGEWRCYTAEWKRPP
jgi:ketosteroid isomerase-like protein